MTDIENYHNWLRDAHAMEKQAEVILIAAIRRSENYPPLRTRLENISMKPAGNYRLCRISLPVIIFPAPRCRMR